MASRSVWTRLLQVLCLGALTSACGLQLPGLGEAGVGELKTQAVSIPLEAAEQVDAEVSMAAGELNVQGGAAELLEGTFRYNLPRWKPEVTYQVTGRIGTLSVKQPALGALGEAAARNRWDLRFNGAVPLRLTLRLGAGVSDLALGDLRLRELNLLVGTGKVQVDLRGAWEEDLDVRITGGAGEGTILLPSEVGVQVDVGTGIGSVVALGLRSQAGMLVNQAYGQSAATLRLRVRGGAGVIRLEVAPEG